MPIVLLFIVSVLSPIAFWFWFFIMKDKAEPEPKRMLAKSFFLGAGVSIVIAVIETTAIYLFLPKEYEEVINTITADPANLPTLHIATILFVIGAAEELLKYFFLREFIYEKTDFNQIADGAFYAITLALGFSLVENTAYFFELYLNVATGTFIATALTRGIATTLVHVTASGIMGYAMGKKKFTFRHKKSVFLGLLVFSMLLHGSFNFFVTYYAFGILIGFPLVLLFFFLLLRTLKKTESILIWKPVPLQSDGNTEIR